MKDLDLNKLMNSQEVDIYMYLQTINDLISYYHHQHQQRFEIIPKQGLTPKLQSYYGDTKSMNSGILRDFKKRRIYVLTDFYLRGVYKKNISKGQYILQLFNELFESSGFKSKGFKFKLKYFSSKIRSYRNLIEIDINWLERNKEALLKKLNSIYKKTKITIRDIFEFDTKTNNLLIKETGDVFVQVKGYPIIFILEMVVKDHGIICGTYGK